MLRDFSKERLDIFIQAGQSNSDGCGYGSVPEPYVPNDRVWFLNNDFTISVAQEHPQDVYAAADFSLTFSEEYINNGMLAEGRKLLIVRAAVGGTGFSDGDWGMEDPLYLRMMEMTRTALELNPGNRLMALLWHQGESEAVNALPAARYYDYLFALVDSVRTVFGRGDLPFIAGDYVQQWKQEENALANSIADATRKLCAGIGNAGFVETDGLQPNDKAIGNGDIIHFSREALYQLGRRYYGAFRRLIAQNA